VDDKVQRALSAAHERLPASNRPASEGVAGRSFDVLDARRRVHVELPAALAQKKLNGTKVPLVNLDVFFKLGPGHLISITVTPAMSLGGIFTSQTPESACGLLRASCGIRGGNFGTGRAPLFVDPTSALWRWCFV